MDQQKAVTVKDIANRLGVSLSTVNKALTGKGGISEQRRKEIIDTAKQMGYRVNHVAQSLARKQLSIGVVFPRAWGDYWTEVQVGMDKVFEELDPYNVSHQTRYVNSAEEMEQTIGQLLSLKIDALIIFIAGFPFSQALCRQISESNIPVFLAGDEFEPLDAQCTISVNARLAGALASDVLTMMLPKGAKVAAFIGSRNINMHTQKEQAFLSAMEESGNRIAAVYETQDDDRIVQECVTELFRDHPDIQGIYVASASGGPLLELCEKLPPEKRPVIVTTDIYPKLRQAMPEGVVAATIFQNQELMGRLAIRVAYEYLCARNSYDLDDRKIPRHIRVTPQILLRSSIHENCTESYSTDSALELFHIL